MFVSLQKIKDTRNITDADETFAIFFVFIIVSF